MSHTMIPDKCAKHPTITGVVSSFTPGVAGAKPYYKVGCPSCGMPKSPEVVVTAQATDDAPAQLGLVGAKDWFATPDAAIASWNAAQRPAG